MSSYKVSHTVVMQWYCHHTESFTLHWCTFHWCMA